MPNHEPEGLTSPASLVAERGILGSLFLGNGLWKTASELLRPEDFSLDSHVRIFRAILELGSRDGSFDSITLAAHLGPDLDRVGGLPYLSELECGGIERSNIAPICDVVRD